MSDVAKLAGVSVMTVSGVFRDPGDTYPVAPETRVRVLEAAHRLGYRPNGMARAMRSQRMGNIGYVMVKETRYLIVIPEMLAGVFNGLNNHDQHFTFIGVPPDQGNQAPMLPRAVREHSVDALIVDATVGVGPAVRKRLEESRVPIANLNDKQVSNSVWVDDAAAARIGTQYILSKGYRRVAFLSFSLGLHNGHYSYEARRSAYFAVMSEAGLPAREIIIADRPLGFDQLEAVLLSKDRPEALVCYSDADAMLAQRVTTRLGLKVPGDLALLGFNGRRGSADLSPVALTTLAIPWYEMGLEAAEMAFQLGQTGPMATLESQRFEATLVLGASV